MLSQKKGGELRSLLGELLRYWQKLIKQKMIYGSICVHVHDCAHVHTLTFLTLPWLSNIRYPGGS